MASWEAEIEGVIGDLGTIAEFIKRTWSEEKFMLGVAYGCKVARTMLTKKLMQHYADEEDASRAGPVAEGVAPSPVPGSAPGALVR